MKWAADNVERRAVASLVPHAKNARTHTDKQVQQIAASIEQWGWTMPVLIDPTGGIIAGHGRVMAAVLLGLEEIPVTIAKGWSKKQIRAYVIADNKLAENAGWDMALLAGELTDLSAAGFDISTIGFSADEISALFDETNGDGSDDFSTLMDRFGVAPFSVLNAREGWWQERKKAWIALGIESELGRGGTKEAAPGGSRKPGVDPTTGKIVRTNSKAQPLSGGTSG